MKSRILMGVASVMMLVFFAGCDKVPQEQIDATRVAIESARAAEADIYVPAEYAALQNEMKTAMAAIEAENSKTFKNFKEERLQLEAVAAKVEEVKANAAVAKDQVKAEVEGLMAEVNTLLATNKELMAKAPKGKEGKAVLEEMRNEITVVEGAVAEATALFEQGKFMDARNRVKAAIEQVNNINTELGEAIAKVKK